MDKEFDWLKGDRLSSIDAFSFAETEDLFGLLELAEKVLPLDDRKANVYIEILFALNTFWISTKYVKNFGFAPFFLTHMDT